MNKNKFIHSKTILFLLERVKTLVIIFIVLSTIFSSRYINNFASILVLIVEIIGFIFIYRNIYTLYYNSYKIDGMKKFMSNISNSQKLESFRKKLQFRLPAKNYISIISIIKTALESFFILNIMKYIMTYKKATISSILFIICSFITILLADILIQNSIRTVGIDEFLTDAIKNKKEERSNE